MRPPGWMCAAFGAALLISQTAYARTSPPITHHRLGLVLHDNVLVHTNPDGHAPVLAALVQQTQVVVLSKRSSWTHVSIWASVHGWIPTREVVFRKPWHVVSTYHAPEVRYHLQAHAAQAIHVLGVTTSATAFRRTVGGATARTLPAGTQIVITSWLQDSAGVIWYQVDGMWSAGDSIQFSWPHISPPHSSLSSPVSGKGMWLTLGPIADSAPEAIVRAARNAGVTHLYLESAISPLGFHGRSTVGPLIDAAHRSHVAVIAWVYPYLYDIAADVALTRQVAAFRTSTGGQFDGIAADLERNVHLSTVRGYSQLVRAYLGRHYLLVGVTYPPQSSPEYPYLEAAHDYDVLAPMDYWHETQSAWGLDYGHSRYSREYTYRYALDSVRMIRQTGVVSPIAPIGQVFDDFGRMEMGPYAPSADEIRGFLQGSKSGGAVGVSFFQWMTATIEEWRTIRTFRY